jgi:hypothetical protein
MGKKPVLKPILNVGHMMTKMGISLPVKCCTCAQQMNTSKDLADYFRAVVPADPSIWRSVSHTWIKYWGDMYGGLLWFCQRPNRQNCWEYFCSFNSLDFEKVWYENDGVGFRDRLLYEAGL